MNASIRLLQALIMLAFLASVLGCANKVTLTISIAPKDSGMVTSPAGQCLGATCDVQVDSGSTVTLTASPLNTNPASTFARWGGICAGTNPVCTFTANTNSNAIAYYRPPTKRVAVGGHHTCALRPAGDVVCWGRNSSGQVGSDSTAANLDVSPVKFAGGALQNIVQIATGGYHSCALNSAGQVLCWGSNQEGALGIGTDPQSLRAKLVPNIGSAVVAITAGGHHSCAVLSNHTAKCWGSNGYGQLGDGTTNHSYTPVAVSGVSGIVALAAGAYHTCALRTDSSVVCWGAGNDGQIGVGVKGPEKNFPPGSPVLTESPGGVPGPALSAWSIAASIGLGWEGAAVMGGYHSCAIGTDQKTYCWGNNNSGQVTASAPIFSAGVNTLARHRDIYLDDPRPFPASSRVAAGAYHTCTVRTDGIACWGDNASGQLGGQVPAASSTRITSVFDLAAGGYHTCAVVGPNAPGTVSCWGWNRDGQVTGTPGSTNLMTPTALTLP